MVEFVIANITVGKFKIGITQRISNCSKGEFNMVKSNIIYII